MNSPFERLDLHVFVTRPQRQVSDFVQTLQQRGASVTVCPLIETQPIIDAVTIQQCKKLADFDVLLITSANGCTSIYQILASAQVPWPKHLPICYCIGEATKKVAERFGFAAIYFQNVRTSVEFAEQLVKVFHAHPPRRILLVHGRLAQGKLAKMLRESGYSIEECFAYDTVDVPVNVDSLRTLSHQKQSVFCFFSPSAVRSLYRQWPSFEAERSIHTWIITIGPTTTAQCKELGLSVTGEAKQPSNTAMMEQMYEILLKYGNNTQN